MWRWPSSRGGSGGWCRWRSCGRWGSGRAGCSGGHGRVGCAGCTAASTPSAGAVLPREGRWLAAVLACGRGRGAQSRQRGGALESLAATTRRARRSPPPRPRKGSRGSACTVLVPSMPRTPPTTKASRPRRSHRTLLDIAARRPRPSPRAGARAGRAPAALRPHSDPRGDRRRANGHRGTKRLANAIAGDPQCTARRAGSPHAQARPRHGLPQPECNTSLDAPDHPGLEADFYFPTHRLVVETDGWDTHQHQPRLRRSTAPRTPP